MNKPKVYTETITLRDGRTITIETGALAKQADGAVVVRMGDAMLLATAVSAHEPREGADFLPLTVDYQEKYAAAGRFPGGFLKREGRLGEHEILTSRLVDRALRPLFPEAYYCDTQVMISLISADATVAPDALAALAASAALTISDIPFQGPIAEVRVAKVNGELVVNPTVQAITEATLELTVSGSKDDINMVEGEMKEVSEQEMIEAIKFAHEAIKEQCDAQERLRSQCGRENREHTPPARDEALYNDLENRFRDQIREVASGAFAKPVRSEKFRAILDNYLESLPEEDETDRDLVKKYYGKIKKEVIRNMVLEDRKRLDGRQLDEVRPIWAEVDYLPGAHGSAVFTRGETQSLTTVTLGGRSDEKLVDDVMFKGYNKFLLHYNFPPFSTGETKPNRGPGRREIGHGNLAMRALKSIMPSLDDNPYTIRVVSDILESNGSSSMATVCAGSMALMDAGIKMKSGVSGIAMGLISKGDKYAILSDILGDEDHLGDMDFKVTGTRNGITACQMDMKVEGLSYEVLEEALLQAQKGRLHILDKMEEVITEPRGDYKPQVPRLEKIHIDKDYIGAIIGPGGKVIQKIQADTGTDITIDEVDGKGVIEILSPNQQAADAAMKIIKGIIAVPEVGETYTGTVKSVVPFGAFVEYMPGKEGLLHISELAWNKTEKVEDEVNEGDVIDVKLIGIDERTGKVKLSLRALKPKPEGYVEPQRRERSDRGDRDRGRGGDRGGRGRD